MIDFEPHRSHLRGVAYRMLGSLAEADDALQEAWLRLSRSETEAVENPRAWLTTVVARICLDMLRSRTSRREEPIDTPRAEPVAASAEEGVALADTVGLAALVVLDTLDPAERVAFVLHDLFGMPFDEIATLVERTPAAARQLASRARRRVRGASVDDAALATQRATVTTFLEALRNGDVEGLLSVLHPDLVVRARGATEIRGARTWAKSAMGFVAALRFVRTAVVDGSVGLILENHGRLTRALSFSFDGDIIVGVDVRAEQDELAEIEIAPLD